MPSTISAQLGNIGCVRVRTEACGFLVSLSREAYETEGELCPHSLQTPQTGPAGHFPRRRPQIPFYPSNRSFPTAEAKSAFSSHQTVANTQCQGQPEQTGQRKHAGCWLTRPRPLVDFTPEGKRQSLDNSWHEVWSQRTKSNTITAADSVTLGRLHP